MARVLFISPQPFFQWRGSPIRVGFDVRALVRLGYEVDLLTLPVGEDQAIDGVTIIRVPNLFRVREVPIGPSLVKLAFDVLLLFRALRLARRSRYDVVHCIEDAGMVGVIVAGISRCKLVFEKHSDASSYRKGMLRNAVLRTYECVERFVMRHADAVIGTGPGLVEQVRVAAPDVAAHHVFDIPSSLADADESEVETARTAMKRSDSDVLVTYVGSFAVYQGIELLFDSIPEVVAQRPDARFVIVGGTVEEIGERRRRLSELGIEDAVVFAGKVHPDKLPNVLRASDILLSPRLAGVNTPLKVLDYLKAGRAIVATDTESNRLLLSDEMTVLAAPEPGPFAAAVVSLIDDAARRVELGNKGRRMIVETYNFDEFTRRIGECYSGLGIVRLKVGANA